MAKQILHGEHYTQSRLAGIMHEIFVEKNNGQLVPSGNVTIYGEGSIITNSKTGEIGLLLDIESEYYSYVPQVHVTRLVDVVDGDGWCDVAEVSYE